MNRTFQKGNNGVPVSYPCRYNEVPYNTGMVNPCDGFDHNVPAPHDVCSDEFQEEANWLVKVAMQVERDQWPGEYLEFCEVDPELSPILAQAGGLDMENPKGCADAVRMDQPAELWNALAAYATNADIPVAPDEKGVRFLERFVTPLEIFGPMVAQKMRDAFEVKYYYGLLRPEEYFESENFAHYPEGCPPHPSYIAGHATVGGAAYAAFKQAYPNAETEHLKAAETATRQFAHFRDFARVHYRQDSRNGWLFGAGHYDR